MRTIARDLQRGTYSRSAFQPDFSYDDGFRSFKGTDKLGRAAWVRDVLKDSKAVSAAKANWIWRFWPFGSSSDALEHVNFQWRAAPAEGL